MKKTIPIILFSLFIITGYGQTICSANSDFSLSCGSTVSFGYGSCRTWSNECGGGWVRSHGTPEMKPYTNAKGTISYTGFLWGGGLNGEGMFTPFEFLANHTYEIKLTLNTALVQTVSGPPINGNGIIYIYAASNLAQNYLNYCGEWPQEISQKQLIANYTTNTNSQWVNQTFTFTPTSNYTQLWIYAQSTNAYLRYDVNLAYFGACPSCEGSITYATSPVSSGQTRSGTINAGSSFGAGSSPVIPQSSQTTRFIATKSVVLMPNFLSEIYAGNYFSAEVYPCGIEPPGNARVLSEYKNIPVYHTNEFPFNQNTVSENNKINVYPSISTGSVNILNYSNSIYQVTIIDQSGRQVLSNKLARNSVITNLDISSLPNGVYFIRLINKSEIISKKIIINK